jgi:uncharacterized metal-binding protein YceD (DUF177 family)
MITSRTIPVAQLRNRGDSPFELPLTRADLDDIATRLGFRGLRKASFVGTLTPEGARDWVLTAHLGATVVQDCVVTLDPVTTRIETDVTRRFLADWVTPEETEVEMPDDDSTEPLEEVIDLMRVAEEALALAAPDFPRVDGALLDDILPADAQKDSEDDGKISPFSALAELRKQLDPKD